ncbi:MAG TPA: RDD family protein [Phycisphaerae bacterium]|jgi:hypothetical protein|nr:RDD family protein [Phycisphaerae bacterium]
MTQFTPLPPVPLCPFCRRELGRNAKLLYNHHVCSKCYYAFANRRQGAFIIDRLAWMVPNFAFAFLVGVAFAMAGRPVTQEVENAINLASWPIFLLFFFKDGFRGYSLGKVICGVQVIDRTTRIPIGFGASFKRNLPLLIPFVPLIVAFQLARGQRLGDGWSNGMVIWKKYERSPVFGAQGFCETCQYDLRGNVSGTCPECGSPISSINQNFLQLANEISQISPD